MWPAMGNFIESPRACNKHLKISSGSVAPGDRPAVLVPHLTGACCIYNKLAAGRSTAACTVQRVLSVPSTPAGRPACLPACSGRPVSTSQSNCDRSISVLCAHHRRPQRARLQASRPYGSTQLATRARARQYNVEEKELVSCFPLPLPCMHLLCHWNQRLITRPCPATSKALACS